MSVHKSSAAEQYAPTPKPHKKKPHKKVHPAAGVEASTGVAGVSTGKTLPFTGLSLLTTLILSLALIVAGVAIRRRERKN